MKYVNKQTQNKHKWCVAFYKSAENAEAEIFLVQFSKN